MRSRADGDGAAGIGQLEVGHECASRSGPCRSRPSAAVPLPEATATDPYRPGWSSDPRGGAEGQLDLGRDVGWAAGPRC